MVPSVALTRLLTRMHPGTAVRVATAGGPRVSGRFAGMLGDTVLLHTASGLDRLPATRIDSVWTRDPSLAVHTLRGAGVGALLATIVTVARSFRGSCHQSTLASPTFPFPNCSATLGNLGRAAITGAALGGVGAGSVAIMFPKWPLRFP